MISKRNNLLFRIENYDNYTFLGCIFSLTQILVQGAFVKSMFMDDNLLLMMSDTFPSPPPRTLNL